MNCAYSEYRNFMSEDFYFVIAVVFKSIPGNVYINRIQETNITIIFPYKSFKLETG